MIAVIDYLGMTGMRPVKLLKHQEVVNASPSNFYWDM